jgi:hypothetical protein
MLFSYKKKEAHRVVSGPWSANHFSELTSWKTELEI